MLRNSYCTHDIQNCSLARRLHAQQNRSSAPVEVKYCNQLLDIKCFHVTVTISIFTGYKWLSHFIYMDTHIRQSFCLQEYSYPDVRDREYLFAFHKNVTKTKFDINKYNELKTAIFRVEYDLDRLRDPLKVQLSTPHISPPKVETSPPCLPQPRKLSPIPANGSFFIQLSIGV